MLCLKKVVKNLGDRRRQEQLSYQRKPLIVSIHEILEQFHRHK